GFEDARLEPSVVHVSDAAWKYKRRRNRRVDIDKSVEIVVRHHLVEYALQVCDPQRVIDSFGCIEPLRRGAERRSQPVVFPGEGLGCIEIVHSAKLRISTLLEIEIERISRFNARVPGGE